MAPSSLVQKLPQAQINRPQKYIKSAQNLQIQCFKGACVTKEGLAIFREFLSPLVYTCEYTDESSLKQRLAFPVSR